MSRSTLIPVLALVLSVGCATMAEDADTKQLSEKIDALEKRIASLEKTLTTKLDSIERSVKAGGGGGVNQAAETEARTALSKINSLVASGKSEDAKKEMGDFMKKYGSTQVAKSAQRLNQELAVVGKQVSDWSGIEKWFQGENDVNLSSGDTTLLVFWEVWCPHCKREVPKLQAMYDNLHGDGLQLIGLTKVNRGSTEDGVTSFMTEKNVSYPVAKENGSLSTTFNVSGVPAAAVVKDGKVIWRGHPARLTEAMLKSWL